MITLLEGNQFESTRERLHKQIDLRWAIEREKGERLIAKTEHHIEQAFKGFRAYTTRSIAQLKRYERQRHINGGHK